MENNEMDWATKQVAAAEAELEQQKQEWKVEQQQAAKCTEERMKQKRKLPDSDDGEDDGEDLTFINKFQVNKRNSITSKIIGRTKKKDKHAVNKNTEKWHIDDKARKKSSYGLRPQRL
jgi:hypothetical protein